MLAVERFCREENSTFCSRTDFEDDEGVTAARTAYDERITALEERLAALSTDQILLDDASTTGMQRLAHLARRALEVPPYREADAATAAARLRAALQRSATRNIAVVCTLLYVEGVLELRRKNRAHARVLLWAAYQALTIAQPAFSGSVDKQECNIGASSHLFSLFILDQLASCNHSYLQTRTKEHEFIHQRYWRVIVAHSKAPVLSMMLHLKYAMNIICWPVTRQLAPVLPTVLHYDGGLPDTSVLDSLYDSSFLRAGARLLSRRPVGRLIRRACAQVRARLTTLWRSHCSSQSRAPLASHSRSSCATSCRSMRASTSG